MKPFASSTSVLLAGARTTRSVCGAVHAILQPARVLAHLQADQPRLVAVGEQPGAPAAGGQRAAQREAEPARRADRRRRDLRIGVRAPPGEQRVGQLARAPRRALDVHARAGAAYRRRLGLWIALRQRAARDRRLARAGEVGPGDHAVHEHRHEHAVCVVGAQPAIPEGTALTRADEARRARARSRAPAARARGGRRSWPCPARARSAACSQSRARARDRRAPRAAARRSGRAFARTRARS